MQLELDRTYWKLLKKHNQKHTCLFAYLYFFVAISPPSLSRPVLQPVSSI